MSKNLVIVESPTKAKTISKFLGPEFKIESSFGHIRDLPQKGFGIDVENDFEPEYALLPDKKGARRDVRLRADRLRQLPPRARAGGRDL